MGSVVDINTRKEISNAVEPEPAPHARQSGRVFDCSRCHAKDQLFKIFATGEINCGDCGARMNNLQVTLKGTKDAA